MRDSDVKREIDNMTEKRANPFSVAQEQYEARWDMIFGRDKGDKERDKAFDKREEAYCLGNDARTGICHEY